MKPIEYIGAPPMKKKRRSSLGGWLLVTFAVVLATLFVHPFIPFLKAQQDLTSASNTKEAITWLKSDGDFGSRLAAAALERTQAGVAHDDAYYKIPFPGGDIPSEYGNAQDVVVRAYRSVGIDLQVEVHADLKENFFAYPQIFGEEGPDPSIDHRRVQNLQRFFSRNGDELTPSNDPTDYQIGDLVVWKMPAGKKHIGIVVPGPGARKSEKWVVHNLGDGPVWEDYLKDNRVSGHYRYGE